MPHLGAPPFHKGIIISLLSSSTKASPLLLPWWAEACNICDGGPTSKQHWFSVLCLVSWGMQHCPAYTQRWLVYRHVNGNHLKGNVLCINIKWLTNCVSEWVSVWVSEYFWSSTFINTVRFRRKHVVRVRVGPNSKSCVFVCGWPAYNEMDNFMKNVMRVKWSIHTSHTQKAWCIEPMMV